MSPSQVVISAPASADIRGSLEYLAVRSETAADRFLDSVGSTAHWLSRVPGAGHESVVPGLRQIRVQGFPNHLLVYRLVGDTLEVVRVVHGARDLPTVLKKEDEPK